MSDWELQQHGLKRKSSIIFLLPEENKFRVELIHRFKLTVQINETLEREPFHTPGTTWIPAELQQHICKYGQRKPLHWRFTRHEVLLQWACRSTERSLHTRTPPPDLGADIKGRWLREQSFVSRSADLRGHGTLCPHSDITDLPDPAGSTGDQRCSCCSLSNNNLS